MLGQVFAGPYEIRTVVNSRRPVKFLRRLADSQRKRAPDALSVSPTSLCVVGGVVMRCEAPQIRYRPPYFPAWLSVGLLACLLAIPS